MKKLPIIAFLLLAFILLKAQVEVRELPRIGYEQRIRAYLDTMEIVDNQEHLVSQNGIASSTMCDFMLLLQGYYVQKSKTDISVKRRPSKLLR